MLTPTQKSTIYEIFREAELEYEASYHPENYQVEEYGELDFEHITDSDYLKVGGTA